jgi:SAM-dependent methyltransferase
MNKAEIQEAEYFNKNFKNYESEMHFNRKPANIKAMLLAKKIKKICKITKNAKILEIGCGAGFFTQFMINQAKESDYYALDISEKMLETIGDKKNLKKIAGSAYDLPFKKNFFDLVIGHGILHHLDIDLCFKQMMDKLKPGGKIFFYEPNAMNPMIFLGWRLKLIKFYDSITKDETAYFKNEVNEKLKSAGFVNIDVQPVEFMLNQVPDKFIPLVMTFSRIFEKIPFIKEIGGSLEIYGEKAI